MMPHLNRLFLLPLIVFIGNIAFSQTVSELFEKGEYEKLAEFSRKEAELDKDELFMVGFAFFQLGNDDEALSFYDKAIASGLNNGEVYFYKGLSKYYQKKYDEALKLNEMAIDKEPLDQEYLNQKGVIYRMMGEEDKALAVFEEAIKLPNTFGEPYFWIAYIHHGKEDFKKALECYYLAADSVPKSNSYYKTTLESIGQLEYSFTQDYLKAGEAYARAILQDPGDYELYYTWMKCLNRAGEYETAEKVFAVVVDAFEKGELPKEDMEIKSVPYGEFDWNGRVAVVNRSLVAPKETLDINYKVFVLSEDGKKVERRFMVEQTLQLGKKSPKFLLCEKVKETGEHITYPYGWQDEPIPFDDLQKAVLLILDGKLTYGAKSNTGSK